MNIYWPSEIKISNNRYYKIYCRLIFNAINRNYCPDIYEVHHIIPKSLLKSRDGAGILFTNPNDISNLVKLKPKEHYIAHRLLEKFTIGLDRHKMAHAIQMMSIGNKNVRHRVCSRVYDYIIRNYKIGFKAGHASKAGKLGGIKGGEYAKNHRTGIHNLPFISCEHCNNQYKLNHFRKHTCNIFDEKIIEFFKINSPIINIRKIHIHINGQLYTSMYSIAERFKITRDQAYALYHRFK